MKIAFLETKFTTSRYVRAALTRSGHELVILRLEGKRTKEILGEIEKAHPDFIFISNFHLADPDSPEKKEQIEEFLALNKYPALIWALDDPRFQLGPELFERITRAKVPADYIYFINDKSFASTFLERGLPFFYMPIGVNPLIYNTRSVTAERDWSAKIRFTGSPLISAELTAVNLNSIRVTYSDHYLYELFEAVNSDHPHIRAENMKWLPFISGEATKFLHTYYTNPEAYQEAEASYYRALKEKIPLHFQNRLKEFIPRLNGLYSWCQMTCYLHELADRGMVVQGSPHWKSFFPQQAEQPRYLEEHELHASYRGAKISFCFTKWSLPTAVHDRILEVLLAGGFPLTDYRSGLEEAFEKDEIAVYHSIDEAKELADYYLRNEEARQRMMAKGTQRVLSSHTYDTRLKEIFKIAMERWNLALI